MTTWYFSSLVSEYKHIFTSTPPLLMDITCPLCACSLTQRQWHLYIPTQTYSDSPLTKQRHMCAIWLLSNAAWYYKKSLNRWSEIWTADHWLMRAFSCFPPQTCLSFYISQQESQNLLFQRALCSIMSLLEPPVSCEFLKHSEQYHLMKMTYTR